MEILIYVNLFKFVKFELNIVQTVNNNVQTYISFTNLCQTLVQSQSNAIVTILSKSLPLQHQYALHTEIPLFISYILLILCLN